MVWLERQQSSKVAQSVRRTLGGRPVIFSSPILGGENVTLDSDAEHGWLTKTQLDAVKALADVPGAVYSLTFGATTISVMFRHNDAPAVDFTPFVPRQNHEAGDYFYGSIKLIKV
jgi:hypothetical protein